MAAVEGSGSAYKGAWKRLGDLEDMQSSLKDVVLLLHYTKDEEAVTAGTFWRSVYARVFGQVVLLAPSPNLDHRISAVSVPTPSPPPASCYS